MKDELSQDARTLLDAARASFSPGEPRIAAVRAAIDARLATPSPHGSEGSLPSAGTAVTGAASYAVALGLFAAVSLAGGAAAIAWRHHTAGASQPMAAAPAPVQAVPPRLPIAVPVSEPPSPAPSPPTVNAEQLPAVALSAPSGVQPVRMHAHAARKDAPPPPTAAERGVLRSAQDDSAGGSAPPPPSPAEPEDSLAREVSLLRAARAALDGGDAARALALLGRHAQLWPGGVLAEERIATQVLALCALGRVADARAAARDLETVAPESPHLARVRASCVRGPAAAGP